MICNEIDGGWEIIFQRAHALLAADLLAPLREDLRPAPWPRVLQATAQHDHGWQEWEPGGRLAEDGTPRHFTAAALDDVAAQSHSAVQCAWHQNRWIALLVARHLDHLHAHRRGQSEALDAFLDEEAQWRRTWRAALGVSREEEDRAYAPLRWADAFSLALCCRQLGGGSADLSPGPTGEESSRAARAKEGAVTVRPWPYAQARVTVTVDAYRLARRAFESHDALIAALAEAEVVPRAWTLRAP